MIQNVNKYAVLIYNEQEHIWEEAGRYTSYQYAKYIQNLYEEKNWTTDIKLITRSIA